MKIKIHDWSKVTTLQTISGVEVEENEKSGRGVAAYAYHLIREEDAIRFNPELAGKERFREDWIEGNLHYCWTLFVDKNNRTIIEGDGGK